MGYLDAEMLLRQSGILAPKPAAPAPVGPDYGPPPSANPNAAAPVDPLSRLLQGYAKSGASIQQSAPAESSGASFESIARKALGYLDPVVGPATEHLGLVPPNQAAQAGAARALGAGGTTPDDVMTTGAPAPAAHAPAPAMGGGGGGGAPQPKEIDLLTKTQRAEYERGMGMQRDAATEGATRISAALAQQEEAGHAYERDMQAQEAGRARAEQARADELRYRQQDYQDAVDQAAKFRIDPNRSSKGGAWFGDMVAILLTGIGGKPEIAIDQIDKRIARDIDAQRAEYQALRDKAGGAQNAYGMAMQRFGDARAAEKVARDALAQQYGAQLQRAAIGMKNAEAENAAQKMLADIQSKYAADTLQFLKATPVGGGAPSLKLPDLDEKSLVTGPDGKTYYVAEGEKTRAKMNAIGDIAANLDEAIRLRAMASPLDMINPYSQVRQRLESLQADTATKRTVYSGQGAMSKGDQEVADKAIGAMTGLLGGNTETLKATRNQLSAEAQRALVSQNAMPVQVVTVINPKTGIPERKAVPSGQTYGGPAPKPGVPGSFKPGGGK